MRKYFLTINFLFITFIVFGQNNYDSGFKAGFKEGYCYNDYGCVVPVIPITPIPLIGENFNNYQDGYNRGFKMGLEKKQAKSSQNTNTQYQYQSTYVPRNYDVILKAMERKEQQYERNEQIKKEKAIELMKQVKSYYNSLNNYPEKISNGWHKVISMNNYDFCDERKVYVEDNKVTSYFFDDFEETSISYPSNIIKGKTLVQLLQYDGSNGDMVELYFLEYINNPNSITPAPLEGGTVSFWTNWKKASSMKLYLDGVYCCVFDSYFENGTPACGQKGTNAFWLKPGTYNFKVISDSKTWSGTVVVNPGGCTLQGILKPTQTKTINQSTFD